MWWERARGAVSLQDEVDGGSHCPHLCSSGQGRRILPPDGAGEPGLSAQAILSEKHRARAISWVAISCS